MVASNIFLASAFHYCSVGFSLNLEIEAQYQLEEEEDVCVE